MPRGAPPLYGCRVTPNGREEMACRQQTIAFVVEIEGVGKPAPIAEWISRIFV